MSFWQERQARRYVLYCIGWLTVFLLVIAILGVDQGRQMKELLFEKETAFASSLLAQGVPEETAAAALNSRTVTVQGEALLRKIGHTKDTESWMFPLVWERTTVMTGQLLMVCLLAGVCFLMGAVFHLRRREALYKKALVIVQAFSEGDFEQHIFGNQPGTIYQLFASVDDLSAALQAKSENEHQMKEFLKNVISDISHQLKTPLAALHMYMEIITEDADNREVVSEFAGKSMDSLRRMEQLIVSLLKIMRLDAGSISFIKSKNLMSELIRKSVEQLLTRAEQEKKNICLEGDEETEVICDAEWTVEAIGNLVKNALDHTEAGGSIWIKWERSPAMVRVTVKDNGSGIAPEDIHHIFKRFYRSKNSGGRQGAGLGLPLAKAIIEGQGGVLTVSGNPGQGAAFFISFLTEV